jgi:hypothetical protein
LLINNPAGSPEQIFVFLHFYIPNCSTSIWSIS